MPEIADSSVAPDHLVVVLANRASRCRGGVVLGSWGSRSGLVRPTAGSSKVGLGLVRKGFRGQLSGKWEVPRQ